MAAGRFLGVDQRAIDLDLEDTAPAGDQRQGVDLLAVFAK